MSESAPSSDGGGRLKKLLPGVAMLFRYERSLLPHDALAGLVVALVLIPSAFSYADLANCAPAAGIYAALGGMVAFAMFTTSRHVLVGPDAAIALLIGTTIGPVAAGDAGKAVTLATVLVFLTAGMLLLMARLRWESPGTREAANANARAANSLQEARKAGTVSCQYLANTVLFAAVLFFASASEKFE
jgi:Sulfate permease family